MSKRRLARVVLLLGLLYPSVALGQETARFRVSDIAAIDQLFDGYNQAFSSKDYVKLRDYLQAPFVGFGSVVTMDGCIEVNARTIRIISARPATRHERTFYEEDETGSR